MKTVWAACMCIPHGGATIPVWISQGAIILRYGADFNSPTMVLVLTSMTFNRFFGLKVGGYGEGLREDVKKYYGSVIGFGGRGEGIARKENYCEIDPTTVDKYGIPVLKFNYRWSDLEKKASQAHAGHL